MIGQNFSGAKRVVVLIEMPDGKQHGWEVGDPTAVKWEFAGLVAGSTHAKLTVRGEFYRMSREGIVAAEPEHPAIINTKEIEP